MAGGRNGYFQRDGSFRGDLRAAGRVRPRGLAPAYGASAAQRKPRLLRPESGAVIMRAATR